MVELKIRFETQAQLDGFTSWLCGQGEQDYWNWMACKNTPEDMVSFDYHQPQDKRYAKNDSKRYVKSKFCNNNIILTNTYGEPE